jgi:hypothetical protein
VRRRLKAGQVWEWSWDGRVEQHLLLERLKRDKQSEEWRSFRLDVGALWTVSFLLDGDEHGAWLRFS